MDELEKQLNLKANRQLPVQFLGVLEPQKIYRVMEGLDASISDIMQLGKELEAAYANRAELIRQKMEINDEIKLVESEAIMNIRGDARSQYVLIGNEKVALSNEQARDAYRRLSSKEQRIRLTPVEAQLEYIDAEISRIKDKQSTIREANENLRAKAYAVAAVFNYYK